MALSFLGQDSAIGVNTDFTLTFTTVLSQNDIVVLVGGSLASALPGTTTTGYTDAFAAFIEGTAVHRTLWAAYKVMGATPDTSAVVKGSGIAGNGAGYLAFYFRGEDLVTQMDATATTTTSNSTNPNPPSITTVTDSAIVVACATGIKDTAITVPTNYNNLIQADTSTTSNITCAAAWRTVLPAGAEDPTSFSNWTTGGWCAASIAIRPAAADAFVPYQPVYQSGPILAQ